MVRDSILDHLAQGPLVPADMILILSKTNKVVNSFAIVGEGY